MDDLDGGPAEAGLERGVLDLPPPAGCEECALLLFDFKSLRALTVHKTGPGRLSSIMSACVHILSCRVYIKEHKTIL